MAVQRPVSILVLATCAALLAGCAPDPVADVTPTPSFASEAEAFAAAEATYRAYVDALNQVDLADPETFEAVYAWTTGEANAGAREYLSRLHADGVTITGDSRVHGIWLLSVTSTTAKITACLDVSQVDLVDTRGVSLVDNSRPDLQSFEVALVANKATATRFTIEVFDGGDKQRCE